MTYQFSSNDSISKLKPCHMSPVDDMNDACKQSDYLENLHNLPINPEDPSINEKCDILSFKKNEMNTLISDTRRKRKILECNLLPNSRILLGAAWMSDGAFREYLRFPEVLFIDATHASNNENRPLLLICGKDSNGKGFVLVRIFMPNETSSFYRWIFLDLLP